MAKNVSVKKSKRRLKKSARRSLAAVLMVTAIAVAAIPVPENFAEDGDPSGTITPAESVDPHDMSNYGYKETGLVDSDGKKDKSRDEKLTGKDAVSLDDYENATTQELIDNLYHYTESAVVGRAGRARGSVYPSLKLNPMGNTFNLTWEFMYYLQDDPRSGTEKGVVCKYNNENSATKVTLSETPVTQYYTVEEQKFDDFYSGQLAKDGDTSMLIDPTQPIKYTYAMYTTDRGELDRIANESVKIFYGSYASGAFASKIADFKSYDEKILAGGDEETFEYLKADLELVPADNLTPEQKYSFYCDFDGVLSPRGSGYHLESVYDNRIKVKDDSSTSSGNSSFVYIARGGTPLAGGRYQNDANGFLVQTVGVQMFAIGNRAFAEVGNVTELELPKDISHIGDEAFERASMISRISLSNVEHIGNRAFKNCDKLSVVELVSGTKVIGAECFAKSAVTSVTLPNAVNTVGYGAFADCRRLATLNLDGISQPCVIKDYAFYNCGALANISMENSNITRMGEGVFAVSGGAVPLSVKMPQNMGEDEDDCIGDYLFAGRSGLQSVVLPKQFGSSSVVSAKLPPAMFHGCTNLAYVEFPADIRTFPHAGAWAEYDPKLLFADVNNTELLVRGPETKDGSLAAKPRECTWDAISRVNKFVPYVFKDSAGVDRYEVVIDGYRYQANEKGELTSCVLVGKTDGNLRIPAKVGNYPIKTIAPGCFEDEKLRESIVTITIEDNSIENIGDTVFKDLPNLEKVVIGNSVKSIGVSAFEGCNGLIDVTFHTPSAGYNNFEIKDNAFLTGSDELTFHGDIVKEYAPFKMAMHPTDGEINHSLGLRICYKSLAPTYQTVMYDAGTGKVTLLDYPKYDQVDDILNEAFYERWSDLGFESYGKMMEAVNYESYRGETGLQNEFRNRWISAVTNEEREEVYASEYYGPWINPEFCDEIAAGSSGTGGDDTTSDNTTTSGNSTDEGDTSRNSLVDFLFEPIVVQAAEKLPRPLAYYEEDATHKNKRYSVLNNDKLSRGFTNDERALIEATKNVVIPEGVQSIDVNAYMSNTVVNQLNINKYLSASKIGTKPRSMYTSRVGDAEDVTPVQPGLFSGYYDDKYDEEERKQKEIFTRGNDRLESITLGSVEFLPDYAFDSCEGLKTVILGPECKDIGTAPFRGCYNLTMVGDNDYFKTQNGIVYSVGTDGSYTIEECLAARGRLVGGALIDSTTDDNIKKVSKIKPGAFQDCDYINTVDLSKAAGLTLIPQDCFKNDDTLANCGQLSSVVLPRTVNEIQAGAFANALKLNELVIPGPEVFISAKAFEDNDDINNPKAVTRVRTYKDSSARRYVTTYGDPNRYNLEWHDIGDQWRVTFYGADGVMLTDLVSKEFGEPIDNPQYVENNRYVVEPADPVIEGWTFDGWLGTDNAKVKDPIYSDTNFIARGHYDNGSVDGKFIVEFYDYDGTMLPGSGRDGAAADGKYYVDAGSSFDAMGYKAPVWPAHDNITNPRWSQNWTTATPVNENMVIVAIYSSTTSGGTINTSGNTTNTSGNTTNNNNTSNRSTSTTSTSNTSSSTSSSSTSTSSTTSDGNTVSMYTVLVQSGSGSGSYAQGATVVVSAYPPAEGMVFSKWTTESNGVVLASISTPVTTFVMPGNNVTITANYVPGTANTAAPVNTVGGTTTPNGNTTVDITKPGISNKDLATANVNGSTDNFIVKISETDVATQAVAAALTNKYGSLDNILYYAMDITLWDSTGTYQLTGEQVAGLSVDITIPIPDALVAYGGNNMAGAVINGNQLENLNESFTTINGVPCIRFRATHFSPYTIYVDTGNLTEGMLDVTPKTGDPIHPKWFLSIGLACLSVILFMKKDKKVKVKTA